MPGTLLPDRLLRRELGHHEFYTKPRGIYGDTKWVRDLDIVNELDGHSGCVNALSWSKSGKLLASGSDDQHLNIHTYQPDHSNKPFALTTTISTGHTANIFSVKFMPHSNDRTLVTCAGDAEIRIFDIEYSGKKSEASRASNRASSRLVPGFISDGVRYLSDGDTNTRIYRSHSDRVKRIVTESSPFVFLSCSEDGEVRQWDIRQPSSAYPRPRSTRSFIGNTGGVTGDVPTPLISYKRYDLDLNTISCSPSQPHYIALGGAHLHCFLHDRRMSGRDVLAERGKSASSPTSSIHDDELISAATKCVRRFAPKAQERMKRDETGHITACKISDANPNEMVVSWSGDWIYNFDLIRSPDARSTSEAGVETGQKKGKARVSRNRKRKREPAESTLSQEGRARAESKVRKSEEPAGPANAPMALRVRYENGQTEDLPVAGGSEDEEEASTASLNGPTRPSRIAKTLLEIRKTLFSLQDSNEPNGDNPTSHGSSLSKALSLSTSILEDMDDIMRTWRYPINPDEFETHYQNTLRHNRERCRRLVQAYGTVSRVLGGKVDVGDHPEKDAKIQPFYRIQSSPLERNIEDVSEVFCYDFIKAICLWLESGVGALVEGFSSKNPQKAKNRRPLRDDASVDDIDDTLIPYLLRLGNDRPIPNVDASRFDVDSNKVLFDSELSAVLSFARAIKIPFADLSRAVVASSASSEEKSSVKAQDRRNALRVWGLKVVRGVLMRAGEGINYAFVDQAFGGKGRAPREIRKEETEDERLQKEVQSDDSDEPVASVGPLKRKGKRKSAGETMQPPTASNSDISDEDEEMIPVDDVREAFRDAAEGRAPPLSEPAAEIVDNETHDTEQDEITSVSDSSDNEPQSDEDEDEEDMEIDPQRFIFRSGLRSSLRTKVNRTVPVSGPIRHYRGAANVRTVKDVNFYGLNDEYVVSGSDSGHFFIWDRATGELLNILEGDGEVVNVVQGHPYEPMLAVSGIDHTIKIFSADKRARDSARRGIGVNNSDESGFSTLGMGGRTRFGRARRPSRRQPQSGPNETETTTSEPAVPSSATATEAGEADTDTEIEEAALAPSGLSSRRRIHLRHHITDQNNAERLGGGNRDAFITRNMLAQLAARVRFQRRRRPDEEGGGGNEEEVGLMDLGDVEEGEEGDAVIDLGGGRVLIGGGGAGVDCNVQ